jgi:UDP-glucose 4-epimerase
MTRRVLITGAEGFVGANLVRELLADGWAVAGIDDGSSGDPAFLEEVAGDIELHRASILDVRALEAACAGATAVVHLAAQSGVPPSIANPQGDFETNVRGTFNVVDVARRAGVQRVAFASSGAVLAGATPPLHEDMRPQPLSPYGASKLYGEAILQAYESSFGMTSVTLRFANLYGPFCAHKGSVVNVFFGAVARGEPLVLDGGGTQTRDFVHVGDICRGVAAALRAQRGGVYHLGTGRETSVVELAGLVCEVAGVPLHMQEREGRPGDPPRNYPDTGRARDELGWTAGTDLRRGLAETWEWLQERQGPGPAARS